MEDPEFRAWLDSVDAGGWQWDQILATKNWFENLDAPTAANVSKPAAKPVKNKKITIEAQILGANPNVARTFEVASTVTFRDLHVALQKAFGWDGGHLWEFRDAQDIDNASLIIKKGRDDDGDDFGEFMSDVFGVDAPKREIRRLEPTDAYPYSVLQHAENQAGANLLLYHFDYGDNWIVIVRAKQVTEGRPTSGILAGTGIAPPNDFGGIGKWNWFTESLNEKPRPEEVEELLDQWYDGDEPEPFNVETHRKQASGNDTCETCQLDVVYDHERAYHMVDGKTVISGATGCLEPATAALRDDKNRHPCAVCGKTLLTVYVHTLQGFKIHGANTAGPGTFTCPTCKLTCATCGKQTDMNHGGKRHGIMCSSCLSKTRIPCKICDDSEGIAWGDRECRNHGTWLECDVPECGAVYEAVPRSKGDDNPFKPWIDPGCPAGCINLRGLPGGGRAHDFMPIVGQDTLGYTPELMAYEVACPHHCIQRQSCMHRDERASIAKAILAGDEVALRKHIADKAIIFAKEKDEEAAAEHRMAMHQRQRRTSALE